MSIPKELEQSLHYILAYLQRKQQIDKPRDTNNIE
jgi:hypothetical protein